MKRCSVALVSGKSKLKSRDTPIHKPIPRNGEDAGKAEFLYTAVDYKW